MPPSDSPAAETPRGAVRGSGLGAITVATVVAGGIGYLILALVARFVTDPARYLGFTTFWSGLYLLVGALSGLQQEVARASTEAASDHDRTPGSGLRQLAGGSGLAVAVLIAASSPLWARTVFPESPALLVAALVVAVLGYVGVAVVSGLFYGLKLWRAVAAMTVTDAVLRLVLVLAGLVAGLDLGLLGWAVALPFPGALALVWLVFGPKVRGRYRIDVAPRVLATNAAKAVGGAVALGVLTSGLPLLLGLAPFAEPKSAVGALTFVVILTRAPLVVPILALQGWLTVYFRDRGTARLASLVRVVAGVLAVALLVSVVAYAVEPWVLQALWGQRYQVDGITCAGVVFTAGLTAALCVSGPATLAAGRHSGYVIGWTIAAVLTVGMLFLPLPLVPRVLLAISVGPVVGIGVHVVALARTRGE